MYGQHIPQQGSRETSSYGFVEEASVRKGAGILFTLGLITLIISYYTQNYVYAGLVAGFFCVEFVLKVINPRYSLIGRLVKALHTPSRPQRVGALQKRFAWILGLIMVGVITILLSIAVSFDSSGSLLAAGILSGLMLALMRLESIWGYCVGCALYRRLIKQGQLGALDHQNCADTSCDLPS